MYLSCTIFCVRSNGTPLVYTSYTTASLVAAHVIFLGSDQTLCLRIQPHCLLLLQPLVKPERGLRECTLLCKLLLGILQITTDSEAVAGAAVNS